MSDLSRERRLEIPRGEPQEPQTSKSSPFEQLLAFNTAAREVKELFNQNDVPRDQVERVVRSFNFPPRQHKAFMRGVDIFLSRRRDVLETKRVYEERFGKRAGEMAFQDFFGLSDTFGAVELSENNDCITFICESPLDVTLVLINTDREKALQELRAIPEESMVEMLEQASEQLPMGLFKNDGGAELPDVGAITSYIVINAAKAKQKGISQDAVLAHERQHAENSLYLRPALERHEQKSQSIRAIADTVENWVDNIQRESSLSPQERSELLTLRLSGIANLVDTLSAQIMDTTVEVLIKEELLAFYAGGEETHKIRDALPAYILDLRSVFARVFILLDKYAKGLPNTILQGAHIDRSSISARDFGDTFACLGIFSTEGEHDDPLARMRKEVSSRLEAFDRMSEQAIQDGTAFLDEMTAYERTHQTRIAEKIFPMLISQPLPRWRSIFQKYLEEPL